MPEKKYNIITEIGLTQPVQLLDVSFKAVSTSLVSAESCRIGHAYSPTA